MALLAGLILLAAGSYAASPWLASKYLPVLAKPYGIHITRVSITRPQWRQLHIDALEMSVDNLSLVVRDATVSYQLAELFDGQFQALTVADLALSLAVSAETDRHPDASAGSGGIGFSPAGVFALVPFQQVRIINLQAQVPALDFTSRGALRLEDQQLSLELSGLTPALARDLQLSAELTARGQVDVTASALREGITAQFLSVRSQIDDSALSVTADLDAAGFPFQLLSASAGLPAGDGRITGRAETQLPWPVDPDQLSDIPISGSYQLSWRSADGTISVSDLAGIFDRDGADVQAVFSGGMLQYADDELLLDMQIDERLQADWDGGQLRLSDGLRYELSAGDLLATGEVVTMTAAPQQLTVDDARLRANVLFDGYRHDGELEISGVLSGSTLTASGNWLTAGWTLPLSLTHSLESGSGELTSQSQLRVTQPVAAALLQGWSELYDLHSGIIDFEARINWAQQTGVELAIDLRDGRIIYDDYLLSGVATQMLISLQEERLQIEPAVVTATLFDPGVPLTDLRTTFSLDDDLLELRDTRFALLGGGVTISDFGYDLEAESARNTISVALSELQLSSLLALEGETIRGDGLISGVLPVKIKAGLPSISAGEVAALAPGGLLQLSPDLTSVSGQPGLDFALTALTNYTYTSLVAGVDYTEDGELTLAIALQGTNPEVENGRPIHYNLNVTQNVLVLLQSLRAQRAVTEGLERRVLE